MIFQNASCPQCGAPIPLKGTVVLIENCLYCGSIFRMVHQADMPVVCECGRGGVNHCARCTVALCEECSNCIEYYDLNQILSSQGVHPRHHARLIGELASSVRMNATLCVPCLDTALGDWLRGNRNNP